MDSRQQALIVVAVGVSLMALGTSLPGNPRAPFGAGGIPVPVFTGIGAGYVVGGTLAYVVSTRPGFPGTRPLFRTSLLSVPLAFLASVLIHLVEGGSPPAGNTLLAGHLGIAVLCYPVAFGLVFGIAGEDRDRLAVTVIAAVLLISVSIGAVIRPEGFGAAVLLVGFLVTVVAGLVFGYPLYRLGRGLTPVSAPP